MTPGFGVCQMEHCCHLLLEVLLIFTPLVVKRNRKSVFLLLKLLTEGVSKMAITVSHYPRRSPFPLHADLRLDSWMSCLSDSCKTKAQMNTAKSFQWETGFPYIAVMSQCLHQWETVYPTMQEGCAGASPIAALLKNNLEPDHKYS